MATGVTEGQMPPTMPASVEQKIEPKLPKLSHAEFQAYNKLAVKMDYFHNMFRSTWTTMYTACERNTRPQGMSIAQFLSLATQFTHHLTIHHTIEEQHIFPMLAARMPEFRPDAAMITQHAGIHAGIDALDAYVAEVRRGDRELRLTGRASLKEVLDGFGKVLWTHLDEEVSNLGAENMRRYWTLQEIKRMDL